MNGTTLKLDERITAGNWGPHVYGATLHVNEQLPLVKGQVCAVDVETDEKDNFVGLAVCFDARDVYYFTDLSLVSEYLTSAQLVGHNLKGDIKWLMKWGVTLNDQNLFSDTMIASYVVNPTLESHGLKPISKVILNYSWPTYSDLTRLIVNGKKKRITLDKLPVDVVARYCGMDCLATWKLYCHFTRSFSTNQRRVFQSIEMPINRLLFRMEVKGVKLNLTLLDELDKNFAEQIKQILNEIRQLTQDDISKLLTSYRIEQLKEKWQQSGYKAFQKSKALNPGSWQQKRLLLNFIGLELDSTDKKQLIKFKDEHKIINLLLQHSEFAKLYNAFVTTFKELPTLPYVHTTFNQVSEDNNDEDDAHGIRTGRLSSKNPNLQQIPARTDNGKLLRKLFIPRDGHSFVVADYSQIELRLAAHFSHDPILLKAFRTGQNIHTATGEALGVNRDKGKLANFLIQYGGSAWALSDRLNMPIEEAEQFIGKVKDTYAVFESWKQKEINLARRRLWVNTIIGRRVPCDLLDPKKALEQASLNLSKVNLDRASKGRRPLSPYQLSEKIIAHEERVAISKIIQGSAADILKLASLECDRRGYFPLLTVHDELVFEILWDGQDIKEDITAIKQIMENIVKLEVPLEVSMGHGPNWGESKA